MDLLILEWQVNRIEVGIARGRKEINSLEFRIGSSDPGPTKNGKHSPGKSTHNRKPRRTTIIQTKARPITSSQTNMSPTNEKRKQSDSMNPNEDHATGKCLYKKSSSYLNDKETKQSTSYQNVGSPQTSVFKKEDSLELSTPKKISETQATSKARYNTRARSNSPLPSLKRKYDGEAEREVKEKTQKKKRKLVDN